MAAPTPGSHPWSPACSGNDDAHTGESSLEPFRVQMLTDNFPWIIFFKWQEIQVNVSGWADFGSVLGNLWLSRDPLAGVHNASSLPAPLDTKEPLIWEEGKEVYPSKLGRHFCHFFPLNQEKPASFQKLKYPVPYFCRANAPTPNSMFRYNKFPEKQVN